MVVTRPPSIAVVPAASVVKLAAISVLLRVVVLELFRLTLPNAVPSPTLSAKVITPVPAFMVRSWAAALLRVELKMTPTPFRVVVLAKITGLAKLIAAEVCMVNPDNVRLSLPVVLSVVNGLLLPIAPDNVIPPVIVALVVVRVNPNKPLMVPLRVSAPFVLIVVSAVKVMLPLAVAADVLLLNKAPLVLTPVPASDSVLDKPVPLRSKAPPLVTVIVPVPKGPDVGGLAILPLPDFRVPELT